jgi:hypothetical protein
MSRATERIINFVTFCKQAKTGALVALLSILQTVLVGQSGPIPASVPETGYISRSSYVNAYFGFLLPLPQDADFHDLSLRARGNSHPIFGMQSQRNGLTALTIIADQNTGDPDEAARKAAADVKGGSVKKVDIAGRRFWKSESEEKSHAGTMRTATYASAMHGFTLKFTMVSFDAKLAKELQHSIESITFVDPAQAKLLAGNDARPFPVAPGGPGVPATPLPTHIAQLRPGTVSGNRYTNDMLGFSLEFPAGWVVADKATQDKVVEAGHQFAYGRDPVAAREHQVTEQCSRILLSATQQPEGTENDEVNPLVALMALDSDCLPGVHLPKSINDTDAIRQLALQISRSLAGTPFIGKGQSTIKAFMLQNRMMLDLSSAFKVNVPRREQPLDVFTSVIFGEDKDYWVMWLFMSGTQSELDNLRNNVKISFASSDRATEQK